VPESAKLKLESFSGTMESIRGSVYFLNHSKSQSIVNHWEMAIAWNCELPKFAEARSELKNSLRTSWTR